MFFVKRILLFFILKTIASFDPKPISNILLIAGGRSKDVEILEIGENQRICDPWPSLKGNPSDVAGGILNLGYPILCHPSQKRCYWAQDGQEVNSGLGIDLRVLGSAAINLNNDLLYITGGFGFTGALNSTEIHAFQEKPKIGPELPFPTSDHCLVQIGLDEFMLIGFDKSANENRYFIYDLSTEKWNEELEDGPRSGSLYSQQYCKAFKVGEKVKVFRSGYAYKSYIFDVSSKKWENGPDLPEKKVSYEIVINPTGDGILMIGGYAGGNYSRNIWEMKCDQTENCDWNMAPYKFQFGRASHTAFYVPENLANCYYPDPNVP